MPSHCGLCKVEDGPGVGAVCWVCEPPHASSPDYAAYRLELQGWRQRLNDKAHQKRLEEYRAQRVDHSLLGYQKGSVMQGGKRPLEDEEFVVYFHGDGCLIQPNFWHKPARYRFWDLETLQEVTQFIELEIVNTVHQGHSVKAWFRLNELRMKRTVIVRISYQEVRD